MNELQSIIDEIKPKLRALREYFDPELLQKTEEAEMWEIYKQGKLAEQELYEK